MLKNISNLGKTLNKAEQQTINGGQTIYLFGQDCYNHFCTAEPLPLPNGYTALCAHPFSCSDGIFQP
ncbi:hypothetical protein ACQY1Q_04765 [Tenacibaculum sp. TC6]|uniref:hypothetical protein n=1 Tax=Tenacibaculum sp. TC6 TaxID=3423223 RepID=UPI003D35AB26